MAVTQTLSGLAEPARSLQHSIAAVVQLWWRAYCDRRDRRSTLAILAGVSDATLKDIGLVRSELESLVNDPGEDRARSYHRHWRAGSA